MQNQSLIELQMSPAMFDLMMTVLEDNLVFARDEETRNKAQALMQNRMKCTHLSSDGDDNVYMRVYLNDVEAGEMICQFLIAALNQYEVNREYSRELGIFGEHG